MPLLSIVRKYPFARLLLLFIAGIAVSERITDHTGLCRLVLLIVILVFAVVILCLNRFYKSFHSARLIGFLASLSLFLCGFWVAECAELTKEPANRLPFTNAIYQVQILQSPVTAKPYTRFVGRITAVQRNGIWNPTRVRVWLYLPFDSSVRQLTPGSFIRVKAAFKPVPFPASPVDFSLKKYLAARHIYRQAFIYPGSWKRLPCRRSLNPRLLAACTRNLLLEKLKDIHLDHAEYGLLTALTLGYREDLETGTRAIFSRAGVMHIMALSGFNVGILILMLGFLMQLNRGRGTGRMIKTGTILLFLWAFAMVTGLSASVVRATSMATFVLLGKLGHRQIRTGNLLFASAFLFLAVSPDMIRDVGFQLSFAAVGGILCFQQVLQSLVRPASILLKRIWQMFTLSLAAQLGTFPLALFYFHQFPVYFWLTNLYVVPLAALIIYAAFFYVSFSWISPLAALLAKAIALMLKLLLFSVTLAEHLPGSLIKPVFISPLQLILLFGAVFSLALVLKTHRFIFINAMLLFILLIGLSDALRIHNRFHQRIIMVGNLNSETVIHLISGNRGLVILSQTKPLQTGRIVSAYENFWRYHGIRDPGLYSIDSLADRKRDLSSLPGVTCKTSWRGGNLLIGFSGIRMGVLSDNRFYTIHASKPVDLHLLLITGNMQIKPFRIAEEIRPDLVLLDNSVSDYRQEQWLSACSQMEWPVYVMRDRGPYVADLSRLHTSN